MTRSERSPAYTYDRVPTFGRLNSLFEARFFSSRNYAAFDYRNGRSVPSTICVIICYLIRWLSHSWFYYDHIAVPCTWQVRGFWCSFSPISRDLLLLLLSFLPFLASPSSKNIFSRIMLTNQQAGCVRSKYVYMQSFSPLWLLSCEFVTHSLCPNRADRQPTATHRERERDFLSQQIVWWVMQRVYYYTRTYLPVQCIRGIARSYDGRMAQSESITLLRCFLHSPSSQFLFSPNLQV